MDSWKDHLKFGLYFEVPFILIMLLWQGWFLDVTLISIFQILILILISPMLPDIDHRQGKLRDNITAIALLLSLIGVIGSYFYDTKSIIYFGVYLASSVFFISYIVKHRGFVHSISMCILYSIGVYLFTKELSFASLALLGFYTHLLADKLPFKFW